MLKNTLKKFVLWEYIFKLQEFQACELELERLSPVLQQCQLQLHAPAMATASATAAAPVSAPI